ncbi:PHD finger protein 6 [Dissostichus eleginoides]|uniref:PHD finger protein 6 n=1 Tax=Dissostichus eleginoides TaxID=100907 RepID=A0AAD9FER2_DISEL|nr:PHD finger protein 6 [Dissostichus eleginoides]
MHEDDRLLCVLCQRSEQTKITGALSTKDDVTAHQNCLLFSSALFCRNTPQFDDLFGFSVDDVLNEVKRGRQLEAESESLLPPFSQPLPASQADVSTQMSPMFPPSEVRCKTERQTQIDDGGSLHMNQELELCADSPEGSPVHSPSDPHTAAPWNIFRGFYKEMSDVSDRIQAEQASQEDYDLALTVMRASGKLLELVGNQQEELQEKQRELQEAAAAMEEAVSALRRDEEQLL